MTVFVCPHQVKSMHIGWSRTSTGFRVGGARGKTKKGGLWWRHHTQQTV